MTPTTTPRPRGATDARAPPRRCRASRTSGLLDLSTVPTPCVTAPCAEHADAVSFRHLARDALQALRPTNTPDSAHRRTSATLRKPNGMPTSRQRSNAPGRGRVNSQPTSSFQRSGVVRRGPRNTSSAPRAHKSGTRECNCTPPRCAGRGSSSNPLPTSIKHRKHRTEQHALSALKRCCKSCRS